MPRHARRGQESGGVANEQALVSDTWQAGPLAESPDPMALVPLGASSGGASDEGQPADAPDDAVAIYLREIGRRALLTAREERELGRCVEAGLRNRVVRSLVDDEPPAPLLELAEARLAWPEPRAYAAVVAISRAGRL